MSKRSAQWPEPPAGVVLDTARGIAMAGVIYAHFMQILSVARTDAIFLEPAFEQGAFLASFIIPLFFLISGAGMAKIETKPPASVLRSSGQLIAFAYLTHFVALAVMIIIHVPQMTPAEALSGLQTAAVDTVRGALLLPTIWFLVVLAVVRVLLYLIVRHAKGGAFWILFAAVFLLTLADHDMPAAFNMRCWAPALLWLMLGYKLAPVIHRAPWQALVPALVATWLLAPLNEDVLAYGAAVHTSSHDRFFVHFPSGDLGFIPLFYPTAALGCLAALSLARLLARTRFQPFGTIGRKTLQLMVVHGFAQALTFVYLATLPVPPLNPLAYLLIAIVAIGAHLVLMRLFAVPLKTLLRLSFKIASGSMDLVAPWTTRRSSSPSQR